MSRKEPDDDGGGGRSSRTPPPSGRRRGGDVGVRVPTPLMRTEAEQAGINQKRLDAELYQLRMIASVQAQQQQVADFVGAAMRREQERQPHATYHAFARGGPPAPPAPPAAPVAVDPNRQIAALERRLEEEKQQSRQKLHEVTAASQQTVNQKMAEMQGEVKKAEEMARAAAAASSTDQRRVDTLMAELCQAQQVAAAAQGAGGDNEGGENGLL